jgi:hypothetical protein
MAVPICPGHRLGDLGQAAEGLTVPSEALFQDHDPFEPAVPFTWGGTDPPAIAFTYAPGRGAIHALKLLDGYRGVVQCDGYAAYKKLAAEAPGEAITLAFCWAHLRRRFYDLAKSGNAPIASEALERIAAL